MKTLGNVIWFVLSGVWMAIGWTFIGVILILPVVTIPFARQCFKLAHFALWPFGRQVVKSPEASSLGPLGAILWLIPGVLLALGYVLTGALLFLTVIGIPFGVQSVKFAGLALQPFGKEIVKRAEVTDALASARAQANLGSST